jgi:hypothetical protein
MTCKELKDKALARLKTVDILMQAEDWEMAAYILGYVVEYALKAVTCKTLQLEHYPELAVLQKDIDIHYFQTHNFEELLLISGLDPILGPRGESESWRNWGDFTLVYKGNWTKMRYDTGSNWDKISIEKLYTNVTAPVNGILSEIKRRRKW